jgi:hypothetical protein
VWRDAVPGGDEFELRLDRGGSTDLRAEDLFSVEVRHDQRPPTGERVGCGQAGDLLLAANGHDRSPQW